MNLNLLKNREAKIFLIVWLVYLFYIQTVPGGMESSQLCLTRAIVDEHRLEVDTYYNYSNDLAFYNGHYYSGVSPTISFLAVPIYIVAKPFIRMILPSLASNVIVDHISFFGSVSRAENMIIMSILNALSTAFITSLLCAISVILLYKILQYFTNNEEHRLLITFIYAFGTLIFHSATSFYSRPVGAVFAFAAFYLLFKMKHEHEQITNKMLFFSGLFAGLSMVFDYTQAILLGLLFLYLLSFLRDKKITIFILASLIPIMWLLSYNYIIFDSPFNTPYSFRVCESEILGGFYGITYPHLDAIFGLTFSPFRGLFIYMPIMFLSFYGLFLGLKEGREYKYFNEALLIALIFIIFFIYNSSYHYWWAGWSFGPRLLNPTIPFLMIPLVFALKKINFKIVSGFCIVSIFINWLGAQFEFETLKEISIQYYLLKFVEKGPSSPLTRRILDQVIQLHTLVPNMTASILSLIINLGLLTLLGLIIWYIWKK